MTNIYYYYSNESDDKRSVSEGTAKGHRDQRSSLIYIL